MPSYPRSELEEAMQRWLDLNKTCEEELNWLPLADMFTEDATYGWNVGPNDEFMAVGRDQIREYAVGLAQQLTRDQAQALETGVELSEGVATLTGLRGQTNTEDRRLADLIEPPPDHRLVWVRVTIHQGWKRQLRRMFGLVGAPVRRLVRVRIGPLRLDPMSTGDVRALTPTEVRRLASGQGAARRDAQ